MLTSRDLNYRIFESEMFSVLNYIENNVIDLEKIIVQNEADRKTKVLENIKKVQLASQSMDNELDILEAENYMQFLKEDFNSFNSYPFHMLYKSQFFLVFSYFESSVIMLYKICHNDLKAHLQVTDRNIDTLERAKLFFVNSLAVNWNNLNNIWAELMLYKDFRNHFIHNSFLISNPSIRSSDNIDISDNKFEKLSGHLNSLTGISLKSEDALDIHHDIFIITDKSFITRFIETSKEFFKTLVIEILDKKRKIVIKPQ